MNSFYLFLIISLPFFCKAQVQQDIIYVDSTENREYKNKMSLHISGKAFLYTENIIYKRYNRSEDRMVAGSTDSVDTDSTEHYTGTKKTFMVKLKANIGDGFQYAGITKINGKSVKDFFYYIDTFTFEIPRQYLKTVYKIFW